MMIERQEIGEVREQAADCSSVAPMKDLVLPGGQVHVWKVDLESSRCDSNAQVLSPDEWKRSEQYHFAKDRANFLARRFALRQILSSYVAQSPHKLAFQSNEWGKPRLLDSDGRSKIEFNMSCSRSLALIAVTREIQVGIDLEFDDPRINCLSLAQRFFTETEAQAVRRLTGASQRAAFFALWTRKEALGKAIGHGLSPELERSDVDDRSRGHDPNGGWVSTGEPPAMKWWFQELDFSLPGCFVTLCSSQHACQVGHFNFP